VQYTSWLGDIKQTYKAVDVDFASGMQSRKPAVKLTDKYLLQSFDDRSVLYALSFVAVPRLSALTLLSG